MANHGRLESPKMASMRIELEKIAAGVPLLGLGVGAGLGAGAGALVGHLEDAPDGQDKTWKHYAGPAAVGALGGGALGAGVQLAGRKLVSSFGPKAPAPGPSPEELANLADLRQKAEASARWSPERVQRMQEGVRRNVQEKARVRKELRASVENARAQGVPEADIVHNTAELDSFMTGGPPKSSPARLENIPTRTFEEFDAHMMGTPPEGPTVAAPQRNRIAEAISNAAAVGDAVTPEQRMVLNAYNEFMESLNK